MFSFLMKYESLETKVTLQGNYSSILNQDLISKHSICRKVIIYTYQMW
jgi:hypothetical protein